MSAETIHKKERQMSSGKQMIERLRQLADGEATLVDVQAGDGTYKRLAAGAEPFQVTLDFFDYDRYSVTLRALAVGAADVNAADARAYLSATAAEIARRLSFLEEPLAVWELDGGEKLALLRSSPPLREGEEVSYWEVTLSAGERPSAQAARYRWAPGMADREAIAYPATFALIGRLTDALAEALQV
jgi:hypothetical protein